MTKGSFAIACRDGVRTVSGYIDADNQIGYAHADGGKGWTVIDIRTGCHIGGGDTRKAAAEIAIPRIWAARKDPAYQHIPTISVIK